jgi:tRNA(Ile)-lysidine synthase
MIQPFGALLTQKLIDQGLDPAAPVLVAYSGGPDSLFLVHVLLRAGWPVIAAHFDHQLRDSSGAEQTDAKAIAVALGVRCETGQGNVRAAAEQQGLSLETAARALRYPFLFERAESFGCQAVLTGHHADDQIETVLMHLLRGAGADGLSGMRAVQPTLWHPDIPLIRPMLGLRKTDILYYLDQERLTPVNDPSNEETSHFRNRIRRQLLPQLDSFIDRSGESILRTAEVLGAENELLGELTAAAFEQILIDTHQTALGLDRLLFKQLHLGLQRRVLRHAVLRLLDGTRNMDFDAIERVRLAAGRAGSGKIVDMADGLVASLDAAKIWIHQYDAALPTDAWPQLSEGRVSLAVPGQIELAGGWRVSAQIVSDVGEIPDAWGCALLLSDQAAELSLRTRRAGDKVPIGHRAAGHKKVADLMIDQKIPERARVAWPIILMDEQIVWVPGLWRLARQDSGEARYVELRCSRTD